MKRVFIFLGLTFAATWTFWWLLAWGSRTGTLTTSDPVFLIIQVLGGTAPTAFAFVAVAWTPECGSMHEFLRRVFRTNVPIRFYASAVLVPLLIGIAGLGTAGLIFDDFFSGHSVEPLYMLVPAFLVSIVLGGFEEVGWRGVLQPAVTERRGLVVGNFAIGALWSVWHLPMFFTTGLIHNQASFLTYSVAGIGYSAFMTWLYHRTRSVVPCILFHAGINAVGSVGLAVPLAEQSAHAVQAFLVLTAGLVLLFTRAGQTHPVEP